MSINGVDGVPSVDTQYILNRMNSHSRKVQLGDKLFSAKQCLVGKYDFAVQGGAVGTVNLKDSKGESLKVPANFVITSVIIDRVTAVTGTDTATTISLGVNSTADLLAATAKTAMDATTLLAGTPVATAATAVKVTAEAAITATIATTAITSGKFYVSIEGFQSRSF